MRIACCGWVLVAALLPGHAVSAEADPALKGLLAAQEQLIDGFRRSDPSSLTDMAARVAAFRGQEKAILLALEDLAATRRGPDRLRVQVEQARALFLLSDYEPAAKLFEQTAAAAEAQGDRDLAFRGWMGAARAHDSQLQAQGASIDFDKAVRAVGPRPNQQQRTDIAFYGSQFQLQRGETEGALVSAYEAERFAVSPLDLFYAHSSVSDVFYRLANGCGESLLIDSRSDEPGDDGTGACRRAVTAAKLWETRATTVARDNGWTMLAASATKSFDVAPGSPLWEARMRTAVGVVDNPAFRATAAHPVPTTEMFTSSLAASLGSNAAALRGLETSVLSARDVMGDVASPASLMSQANAAELAGDEAPSLQLNRRATRALLDQRNSFFDPEGRGAIVEGNVDVPRDLAMRLLQQGAKAEAFDLLESFRSRGLGEVAAALAQKDLPSDARSWLSRISAVDAELRAAQKRVVEQSLGAEGAAPTAQTLAAIEALRGQASSLMADERFRSRFAPALYHQSGLADLQAAVSREHVPALVYWSTWPLTVVWLITPEPVAVRSLLAPTPRPPDRVNVRAVPLNEPVLLDRLHRLRSSLETDGGHFDADAARQLYLYLIQPFEQGLGDGQILIIPQGALADVPFEALIAPDGRFLVQRWAVSYAPSATMAVATLARPAEVPLKVAAIEDETIGSDEMKNIGGVPGMRLTLSPAHTADALEIGVLAGQAPVIHVLAHGVFDDGDPLLSTLKLGKPVRAADLLAIDLHDTRLMVLSACEGAVQGRRLSNEMFGFPWALQVAGVQNAVMSRWAVPSEATSVWMPAFYRGLGLGLSPANASARASRTMIAGGDSDPHRWAAMQVLGR